MESPTATPAPLAPAAPAPAAAPQTQTAVEAAVSGSPRDYRDAKRAERAGKPLPAVAVAEKTDIVDPAAGAKPGAAAPTPQLSKRQQEINDRAQRAVDAATTQLRDDNARLQRELDSARRPAPAQEPARASHDPAPAAPAPPVEKFPSLDVWAAQQANEGKTFNDYLDDRDTFNADQRDRAQRVDQEFKARAETLTKQSQTFATAMGEAIKAEPDLASKIPPAMRDPQASTPLSAMSSDQLKTAKFSNLVAEAAFRSAHPAALLKHLHAHQDDTIRIAQLEQQHGTAAALGALRWLDAQLGTPASATASPATPAAPKVKTISAAPSSQDVLGKRATTATDPMTSAIRSGDTRAYRQQRREERASGLKR